MFSKYDVYTTVHVLLCIHECGAKDLWQWHIAFIQIKVYNNNNFASNSLQGIN